ncbi:hypothetical protein [Hymenobacter lucidus]|uniref:Lipoprotein n=1 Tax=Hymenobacter lucidus TaxID=2880930 RepID=A0ABS8AQ07_9BACT|nr:hypothetical protein [Hymenobacter lucidus]MCB2408295.1 hypothetical protein [Hymenobacter lucidus]
MQRNLLTWFLLLGSALAISACCANNECVCLDNTDDAVYLKFSLDSLGGTGFFYRELRTIYIRRIPVRGANETAVLPAPDSVLITRTRTQLRDTIVLSPTTPFTSSGRRFDAYSYVIRLARREKDPKPFIISNLSVQGVFDEASGCCTCYRNSVKTFKLTNGLKNNKPDTIRYNFSGLPAQTLVLKR